MNSVIKHFENLWEESESFSLKEKKQKLEIFEELKLAINSFDDNPGYYFGVLLFNLTNISAILNINAFAVLQKHLEDKKTDFIENDLVENKLNNN